MKRILKIGLWVLAAVALVGATALAAAGPLRGMMFRKHLEARIDAALDAAKATPEQRQAIHAAADRAFASMKGARADHAARLEELGRLFVADRVDGAKLQAMVDEHVAEAQQRGDAIVAAVTEAHQVLSPEQRKAVVAELQSVRAEHEGRWKQHAGPAHAAMMKQLMEARLDEALSAVKANPPQRAAVHAAFDHVAGELQASFADRHADLDRALALFAENTIDPAKVQALREGEQAKVRRAGAAMVQAFHDVHDALTFEQRQAALEWVRTNARSLHPHGHGACPSCAGAKE